MSEVVEVDCIIARDEMNPNKYILYPKTGIDKCALDGYIDKRGRQIRVRLINQKTRKSYDQTKAFFALVALHYKAFNGHSPTSKESEMWYETVLKPELFPCYPQPDKNGRFIPKGWSVLTMEEGIDVISKMLSLVSEQLDVPDDIAASCSDLFEWVKQEKLSMAEKKAEELKASGKTELDEAADELQIVSEQTLAGFEG